MLDALDIKALQEMHAKTPQNRRLAEEIPATLVAISEDPRESELLALFRSKDARGKECLIRMARVMPCGECS